jgi:hypothetical protein
MKICDDDFYWFITFKIEESEENPEVREALGLSKPEATMNLWPCRWCGAMVAGGLRAAHRMSHRE